jgi:hypothetical protein
MISKRAAAWIIIGVVLGLVAAWFMGGRGPAFL